MKIRFFFVIVLRVDPLSRALELLRPRQAMCGGFDAAGDWSVSFPQHDGLKCYALLTGECWLAVEGLAEPVRLSTGDCLLLPGGLPFVMASDLALEPVDFLSVIDPPARGRVITWNGGGEVTGLGAFFSLAGVPARALLSGLPPVLHVRQETGRTALRWSMERMMQELREPQPGGELILQHLAHLTLIQALRSSLTEGGSLGTGWLSALADVRLSRALHALHAEPARAWTLEDLARQAGMSRSVFAQRFRRASGMTPIDYLIRWRMLLAADRLQNGNATVGEVALGVGYESESAFSTAFRRVMGVSPRRYARGEAPGVVS